MAKKPHFKNKELNEHYEQVVEAIMRKGSKAIEKDFDVVEIKTQEKVWIVWDKADQREATRYAKLIDKLLLAGSYLPVIESHKTTRLEKLKSWNRKDEATTIDDWGV